MAAPRVQHENLRMSLHETPSSLVRVVATAQAPVITNIRFCVPRLGCCELIKLQGRRVVEQSQVGRLAGVNGWKR